MYLLSQGEDLPLVHTSELGVDLQILLIQSLQAERRGHWEKKSFLTHDTSG